MCNHAVGRPNQRFKPTFFLPFGFPIISLAYAFFARHRRQPDEPDPTSAFGLFLKLNPAYKYLSLEDQAIAFAHWRNQHAKRHQADP